MKKFLAGLFLAASVLFVTVTASVWAAEPAHRQEIGNFEILVGAEREALGHLSAKPYYKNETLMVPLRPIAEALGYSVVWQAETGQVTVEDAYTQKAMLQPGTKIVAFEGKLTVIDLSRQIEAAEAIVMDEGCTFVPLAFFEEFFNTTCLEGDAVIIEPEMAYVQDEEMANQ